MARRNAVATETADVVEKATQIVEEIVSGSDVDVSSEIVPVTDEEIALEVPAWDHQRQFFTINYDGVKTPLTEMAFREYEEDRSVRMVRLGEFNVGQMSRDRQLIDHYTVVEPLMQEGFTRVDLLNHRSGGVGMLAILSNPDITLDDFVGWDKESFPRASDAGINLCAKVDTSFRPGHGIRVTFGFFRVICRNGMTFTALQLGGDTWTHRNWNPEDLRLQAHNYLSQEDPLNHPALQTERSSRILDWPIRHMHTVLEDPESIRSIPMVAQDPLRKLLEHLPGWGNQTLVQQLQEMRDNSETITLMDLANAITNVASLRRNRAKHAKGTHPAWSVYERLDPLMSNLIAVTEIGALVSGEPAWILPN